MSFTDDLRRFERKTLDKMSRAARKITLEAFSNVIMMSPVDTGRFRGNWQAAIGDIPGGTVEAVDPNGTVVIAKVQGVTAGMEPGDVIYMANNLPYAQRLEDGHSRQAPAGMVKLTVQRFQPIAEAVIRQIGAE
jgi:hypothetical protein